MMFFARDRSDLVYRPPLLARVAFAAFAVAALAVLLPLWSQVLALSLPAPAMLGFGALWLAMIALCAWMALSVRTAFVFGVDGVGSRRWWGTRTLAYAHMAGCTVVHEAPSNGRRPAAAGWHITFEPMRRGVPPLRLFVQDDLPLNPAIVRRLKTVPGLSRRQLKLLELASSAHVHGPRTTHTPESLGEA